MKRCPECRRDYYDDTLSFCLEDGTQLVQGSVPPGQVSSDEAATAILHSTDAVGDAPTRAQIHTTEQTAVFPRTEAEPQRSLDDLSEKQSFSADRAAKPLVIIGALAVLLVGGFFGIGISNLRTLNRSIPSPSFPSKTGAEAEVLTRIIFPMALVTR